MHEHSLKFTYLFANIYKLFDASYARAAIGAVNVRILLMNK